MKKYGQYRRLLNRCQWSKAAWFYHTPFSLMNIDKGQTRLFLSFPCSLAAQTLSEKIHVAFQVAPSHTFVQFRVRFP